MIEIPQNVLNKFIVRGDYIEWIKKEALICVYLDLANMLHWQDVLDWKFRIEDVISQLLSFHNVKEVKVYYGLNEKDLKNSKTFHNQIKKSGVILRAKPMKFITKKINESLFFQRKTITLFDPTVKQKIDKLIVELQNSGLIIEEPKCNFDVEMAMDMLDDAGKISAVLVFSGDSDLSSPLERIKVMGKQIGIVGVRGKTAGELHRIKNKYFDFGKFYNGKRTPFRSENPAKAGPRE